MELGQFFGTYTWAFQAFCIIFVALIASYIETRIHKRLVPRLKDRNHPWQLALAQAFHAPFHVMIWLVGVLLAAQIAAAQADDFPLANFFVPMRKVGVAFLLVWFLIRLIRQVETNLLDAKSKRFKMDETSIKAIGQLLRVSILITSALILMQSFGVPISGVIAFGGIGAAAVGFAAKDLLANFFGGFMIYLDRPFAIGDWIRSPDRDIEGIVEDIGWRLTRLRTFDKRPLYIPNGIFSNISIENPSRMRNRRIKTNIGVRYDDAKKLPAILSSIREMLQNHPEIDTKQLLLVNFIAFGPSSLDIQIYTFTKTTNWGHYQNVQEDVFLKVLAIIAEHGAEVAFPTQTVHLAEQ
ncbi:MAG: mechanosensitive ion channel family protein [Chlamydiia bacterium]|nr:mechanosensitive ion channel family protein [Chlamydiia bacterium]MCP5492776.1 mechanosensitive ion channel family protein [Chlamydiales bacterium]